MDLQQSNTQTPVYFYTRTEILAFGKKTSLLSLFTVHRLKDLNIGYYLPRCHRLSRGVKSDPNGGCLFAAELPTDTVGSQSSQTFSTRQTPHLGDWWGELTTTDVKRRCEWKLCLRGRITHRHCRHPKLLNFLCSSNRLFVGGAADTGTAASVCLRCRNEPRIRLETNNH